MKNPIQSNARGFTLVELMVAMAITTILVTILISITSISLDTWNRSRSEIRAARQAQAMTEIMARDFEAMVMRPGNDFEWLFAQSVANVGPSNNLSPNSADIILFTAATDRYDGRIGTPADLGGDISTVGYTLRYNDPINTAGAPYPTFVLYRKLINPDETFSNLLGLNRDGSPNRLKATFDGAVGEIDDRPNFVCENVYQFSVTFHIETADTKSFITLAQNASSSIQVFGDGLVLDGDESAISNTSRITAVEISITVLSDNAMNTLRNNPNLTEAAQQNLISKNSFQYSKLIEVPRL